jgi:hypothetical protein
MGRRRGDHFHCIQTRFVVPVTPAGWIWPSRGGGRTSAQEVFRFAARSRWSGPQSVLAFDMRSPRSASEPKRTAECADSRDWFKPNRDSRRFILPGLVAVLSTMMAVLVSALSLAPEREPGTFEQLLVTPRRTGASPVVVLSGYAAPVENMPEIVAFIGHVDPVRWMLIITRDLFLQDMPASLVPENGWKLALLGGVAFAAAWIAVRRVVT